MTPDLEALEGHSLPVGFWEKVVPEPNSGCWLWIGARLVSGGYGVVNSRTIFGGLRRAHRATYEALVGPLGDLHALHSCDNPPCVNPKHLFKGTDLDNIEDMKAKGRRVWRGLKGERHPSAKLSAEQAAEIRSCPRSVRRRALAQKFGISISTIEAIRSGRLWNG